VAQNVTLRSSTARGPSVSVVIPTRDRCRHLLTSLQSALGQLEPDLEIVVVDDGSRDGTSDMVGRLVLPGLRLVRNDPPRGESGARNRGIAEARGDWVAFLDDDDLWAPTKIGRQLQAMHEARRQWAYAGDVVVDSELRVLYGAPPPDPDEVLKELPHYNSVPAGASNVIVSAEFLRRAGLFDPALKRTADWDMWLRLAQLGPPACVREPLVAIRVHPGNTSRDMSVMFGELHVLARRYGISVDRARHYRWAAWEALRDARRWQAVRYYAAAVAEGDIPSVGRAAVALLGRARTETGAQETPWMRDARGWIDRIAPPADLTGPPAP
jgi:glycosyltransferase involved in cell wall biosynthesis